jgi:hypothetical protein
VVGFSQAAISVGADRPLLTEAPLIGHAEQGSVHREAAALIVITPDEKSTHQPNRNSFQKYIFTCMSRNYLSYRAYHGRIE